MNTKKFIIAFVVVFVVLEITNYLIYVGILGSVFENDMYKSVFQGSGGYEQQNVDYVFDGFNLVLLFCFLLCQGL